MGWQETECCPFQYNILDMCVCKPWFILAPVRHHLTLQFSTISSTLIQWDAQGTGCSKFGAELELVNSCTRSHPATKTHACIHYCARSNAITHSVLVVRPNRSDCYLKHPWIDASGLGTAGINRRTAAPPSSISHPKKQFRAEFLATTARRPPTPLAIPCSACRRFGTRRQGPRGIAGRQRWP